MKLRKNTHDPKSGQEILLDTEAAALRPARPWQSFLKKHWKALTAAGLAVVVAAAVLLPQRGAASSAGAEQQYQTAAPEKRSIINTFSDSGTLSAANTYTVQPLVKGTVLTADFEVGDEIEAGQVLYTINSTSAQASVESAELSLAQAQANYDEAADALYLRADVAGELCELTVAVGDTVTAGQQVAAVRDDSTMLLTLTFPAAEAAAFTSGQAAEVTVSGTFETLAGAVLSVSGVRADGGLQVREVVVAVPNPGSLTAAQAATASVSGVSAMGSANFSYYKEQVVTAESAGTVAALCAAEGEQLRAGDAILQLSSTALDKQLTSAEISLRNAELSLSNAQEQLDEYTITSPISGTVIQKLAKAGDTISSSTTSSETLCVIYDLSYLEMTLQVDELEILSIEAGQSVQITADALPDETFTGVVTSVSAAGSTTGGTTTYPVTVRIEESGQLMPGMNATAEITIASAEDALSVPNAAIVRGGYVLVTDTSPSAANADASMAAPEGYVYVPVETGVSDDDYIQITSGLTEEDTIAYDPSLAAAEEDEMQMGGMMMPGGGGQGGQGGGPGGGQGGGPGGGF